MEGSRRIGGSLGAVKVARPAAGGGKLASALSVLQELPITTKYLPSVDEIFALGWYTYHAETIMGNMDSVIFLGGREHSTVKELSDALGKETISMQTESRTKGQSESYGQNMQRLGKELMTIDELTTMNGNKCILQLRGLRPFFSPKYDLRKHPNFRYTAEANGRNAFDIGRLINRRMKLNPNEEYMVFEEVVEEAGTTDDDEDILNYDDVDDPEAFA